MHTTAPTLLSVLQLQVFAELLQNASHMPISTKLCNVTMLNKRQTIDYINLFAVSLGNEFCRGRAESEECSHAK